MANFLPANVKNDLYRFLRANIENLQRDRLSHSEVCVRASKAVGCRIHNDNLVDALIATGMELRPSAHHTPAGGIDPPARLLTTVAKLASRDLKAPVEPDNWKPPTWTQATPKPAPEGVAQTLATAKSPPPAAPAPPPSPLKAKRVVTCLTYLQRKQVENWIHNNLQRMDTEKFNRAMSAEAASADLGFKVTPWHLQGMADELHIQLPIHRHYIRRESAPTDTAVDLPARQAIIALYREFGLAVPPDLTA